MNFQEDRASCAAEYIKGSSSPYVVGIEDISIHYYIPYEGMWGTNVLKIIRNKARKTDCHELMSVLVIKG